MILRTLSFGASEDNQPLPHTQKDAECPLPNTPCRALHHPKALSLPTPLCYSCNAFLLETGAPPLHSELPSSHRAFLRMFVFQQDSRTQGKPFLHASNPLFLSSNSYLPHTTVSLGSHSCICPKQKAPCLRTGFLSTPCSVSTAPSESSHSLPRASGKPSSRLCRGLRAQTCCLQHGEAAAPALQTQHCCPVFPLQQALAFTAEAAGSVGTSRLSAAPLLPHSAASPSELQHSF